MGYAIAAFVICFLLAGSGLLLLFHREMLGSRLAAVLEPHPRAEARSLAFGRLAASVGLVAKSLQKAVPGGEQEAPVLRQRLVRAGFRSDNGMSVLNGLKIAVPLVLCVIAAVTGAYRWNWFIVFATAIVIGYLIPDYVLDHLIKGGGDSPWTARSARFTGGLSRSWFESRSGGVARGG